MFNKNLTILIGANGCGKSRKLRDLRELSTSLNSPPVHHFLNTEVMDDWHYFDYGYPLSSDGKNIGAFLYTLQETHTKVYASIMETISLVFPSFSHFSFYIYPFNIRKVRFKWHTKYSDSGVVMVSLSPSTLRFLTLTTLLLQPNLPNPLLIDEPELGLNPYALCLLASLLKDASTRTKVVIATQSSTLIDWFTPEEIVVVHREGNKESTFTRQSTEVLAHWLEDYTISQLWEKNVIGGRP